QFLEFLSPPGATPPPIDEIDHCIVREYVGSMYERRLQKAPVARKLAALRTFFRYCVRERLAKQNPARLVSTPKLPKRVPRVLTAEELNGFLDPLASDPAARNQPRKQ